MAAVQGPVEAVHSTNIVPVQTAIIAKGPTECHGVVIHRDAPVVKIL